MVGAARHPGSADDTGCRGVKACNNQNYRTDPRLIGHSWSDSSSDKLHLALIRSFPLWSWSEMCWRTASRMDLTVLLESFEITSSTLIFSPSSYIYRSDRTDGRQV